MAELAPMPISNTVVGLLVALLVIVTEPVLVPVAVRRKVTLIVRLAPAAMLAPQVFVCAKSPLAAIEPADAVTLGK